MSDIEIRKVTKSDIDEILKISEKNKITNIKDASSGFLVSGYTKEQYVNYLQFADYFYVACVGNKIAGVLLAFNSNKIKENEIVNNIVRYSVINDFVLIKQIFVEPSFKGKKIAIKLYEFLFAIAPKELDFAAAIVGKPFNAVSVKFHEKTGFEKLLRIVPNEDADGVVRHRDIWYKKSTQHRNIAIQEIMRVKIPNDSATTEMLLTNLENTTSLYMHEDNLNWTKFGMLVTFVFALCAAFSHFYEKTGFVATSITLLVIILGFLITNLFSKKISSGLEYMGSHKNNLKMIERKLKYLDPNFETVIDVKNKNIANQSKTTNIMYQVSKVSYVIWAVLLALWLSKSY